jgi:hypothetical protein
VAGLLSPNDILAAAVNRATSDEWYVPNYPGLDWYREGLAEKERQRLAAKAKAEAAAAAKKDYGLGAGLLGPSIPSPIPTPPVTVPATPPELPPYVQPGSLMPGMENYPRPVVAPPIPRPPPAAPAVAQPTPRVPAVEPQYPDIGSLIRALKLSPPPAASGYVPPVTDPAGGAGLNPQGSSGYGAGLSSNNVAEYFRLKAMGLAP